MTDEGGGGNMKGGQEEKKPQKMVRSSIGTCDSRSAIFYTSRGYRETLSQFSFLRYQAMLTRRL